MTVLKVSELMKHDSFTFTRSRKVQTLPYKDALTGYSGHILLFLFLSHIYIPTMAFKP